MYAQLVVTGDFFQLPPVNKVGAQMKFAFEAELWQSTIKRTFNLTKVFRQKDQGATNNFSSRNPELSDILGQNSSICLTRCDSEG
jgi:hypothetical protein